MNEIHVLTFKVLTLTLILGQIEPYHTHTTPMIYYILKVLYSFMFNTFLDKIFLINYSLSLSFRKMINRG